MNISKDDLYKLLTSINNFEQYMSKLFDDTNGVIDLFNADNLLELEQAIVLYLDSILPGKDEFSYWVYDSWFGKSINKIKVDGIEFDISNFDNWYTYLEYLANK